MLRHIKLDKNYDLLSQGSLSDYEDEFDDDLDEQRPSHMLNLSSLKFLGKLKKLSSSNRQNMILGRYDYGGCR